MYRIRVMDTMDKDSFVALVRRCRGRVLLELTEKEALDLKAEPKALELLRLLRPEREGLIITLTDGMDLCLFLNFLMQGQRCS